MNEADTKAIEDILARMERKEIRGISIDSRTIREGELFVAIKGDRFDGHDFAATAIKQGAWGALVGRHAFGDDPGAVRGLRNIVPVDDTLVSLQEMSLMHRKRHAVPVVGITGSNGKTTTKEMTAGILGLAGTVLKNEGNLNNHIGVPLTLLKLDRRHSAAVIEMGMSAAGEIALLTRLAAPTVGVITNIGPAHLEFLKSTDNVARAKGELLETMDQRGTAVLNADDRYYGTLRERFGGTVRSFGIANLADVTARDIRQERESTRFTIVAEGSSTAVRLPAVGMHNVLNALAATAAALAAGAALDAVKTGLERFRPLAMRSELRTIKGRTVFADCYNANPGSMRAALETLALLRTGGRAVAVLGDMLELGEASAEAHREIGRAAARSGVDVLIVAGRSARFLAEGARQGGMDAKSVFEAETTAAAARLLREHSREGDAVLVKGSRGMKMETVLEEF